MTKIFPLMVLAACAIPCVSALAQSERAPRMTQAARARQTATRPTPPTDNRPTGPFDNQLKKFSAPLSANGGR